MEPLYKHEKFEQNLAVQFKQGLKGILPPSPPLPHPPQSIDTAF